MEVKLPRNRVFDRIRIPSWAGSILFHLCILALILLYFRLFPVPPSAPGDRLASGGIVLTNDSDEHTTAENGAQQEDGEKKQNDVDEPSTAPTLAEMLEGNLSEVDLNQNLPKAIGPAVRTNPANGVFVAPNLGDSKIGGSQIPALGNGKGGGKTLRVFGTEGTGNSFVFVFDRSSSMSEHGSRPIQAAKAELIQSLDSLENLNRFNIIFYNEKPSLWKSGRKMIEATDQNKENAKRFVHGITPAGGTRHFESLIEAINHRPDVIFFLTDGDDADALSPGQLAEIAKNNNFRTQINAIQFGVGAKRESAFLRKLTAQNHGQYTYINVVELK